MFLLRFSLKQIVSYPRRDLGLWEGSKGWIELAVATMSTASSGDGVSLSPSYFFMTRGNRGDTTKRLNSIQV